MSYILTFKNARGEQIAFGAGGSYTLKNLTGIGANDVQPQTDKAFGQQGVYFFGMTEDPRIIAHDATIIADSEADLEAKRLEVARISNPSLGLGQIILNTGLNKYQIGAAVTLKPDPQPMNNQYSEEFSIAYFCPKPDFLSFTPTTIKMVDFVGGLMFPLVFPIEFAERGMGATINYEGNNPASVMIDLRGPAVNPIIENKTTGLVIRTKNLELAEGEKLLIDTNPDAPSVMIADSDGMITNAWNHLKFGSVFWALECGENVLGFSADSGTPECYLTYYTHYAGI